MKLVKVLSVILGILMIIGGLYCVFNPALTYLGIGYVIGIVMLLDAVNRLHAWWQYRKTGDADGWMLASGIISCVFALTLIVDAAAQLSVDVFIAYMVGIWILVRALITIIRAFRARKFHKAFDTNFIGKNWWVRLIIGLLMCLFAVLSLMNPTVIMAAIGTFIGIGIILAGCETVTIALTPREVY
ncbi:MAG: DUF308 domain-containing protein [Clostridia bacterium]|nr:DUF308 domain-containing protein [Clostridia bacterium]